MSIVKACAVMLPRSRALSAVRIRRASWAWQSSAHALPSCGLVLIALACSGGGGDGGPTQPPKDKAEIQITTPTTTIAVGEAFRFSVQAKDAAGNFVIDGAGATFTTDRTAILFIEGDRAVVGQAPGVAHVMGKIGNATTSVAITVVSPSPFELTVFPDSDVPLTLQRAASRAIARWRRVIRSNVGPSVDVRSTDDLCGALPAGSTVPIAGIRIRLRLVPNLGVPAAGGPCVVRTETGLALTGLVSFNTTNPFINDQAYADRTMIHEIGHVLGIGTWWFTPIGRKYYPDTALSDPYFNGPSAVAGVIAVGGAGYLGRKVPVEVPGGTAAPGSHWRGSVVGPTLEVMQAGSKVSQFTVNALADMGWSVDSSSADIYALPTPTVASLQVASPPRLGDEVLRASTSVSAKGMMTSILPARRRP